MGFLKENVYYRKGNECQSGIFQLKRPAPPIKNNNFFIFLFEKRGALPLSLKNISHHKEV